MPRALQLIVNPHAGAGRARRALPAVERTLRRTGHDVRTTATRSLAHAQDLAAQAVADGRVAVALGGDGLVGRVAGVVAGEGGLLGVLPGGRGNDFARSAKIPGRPVPACRVLSRGEVRTVDLGEAHALGEMPTSGELPTLGEVPGRFFLGIASAGIDGVVQERVARARLPLGRLTYAAAALTSVAGWRPVRFRLVADGESYDVVGWSCAAAGSGVYGGGMRLAPDASLTDGLLDVVTSGATSRAAFVRALPRLIRGTHVRLPTVRVRRAAVVELSADRPLTLWADGEPVGPLPCRVSVRPGALRVLLPAGPPARRARQPTGPDRPGVPALS